MPNLLIHHAISDEELQRLLNRKLSNTTLLPDRGREDVTPLRERLVWLHEQLPYTRVATFAKVYENDTVLRRFPLVLLVRLRLGRRGGEEIPVAPLRDITLTIGSLATDHVGYASFDLRPLRSYDILDALARLYPDDLPVEDLRLDVEYLLLPFGENQRAIDLLSNADVGLDTIVMRLQIEAAWLADREPDPSLPAMQNPSIDDWRLSPGSFALAPARLVGDADCEDLYPSDLSSHSFRFHRLVRLGKTVGVGEDKAVSGVGFGYVTRYRSDWYPLGHSLGRVLYSLPLAPGEKVNLAIIDWQRQDDAFRDETTNVTEQLQHDTQRDRVVGEVVRASIREKQRGHSIMGGLGASVLAPVGGAIIGGSLGLGGSKRSTSGTRDIVADTVQDLSDGFSQASTAFRELRSTVVTQTSQVEGGRFETRRIANFNHCHTLTIVYYEVLRHYRTSTVYTGREPVLYVDYTRFRAPYFGEDSALACRVSLEAALLDGRYASGFDALSRKRAAEQRLKIEKQRLAETQEPAPGTWQLTRLVAIFHTGSQGHRAPVRVQLVRDNGTLVTCRQLQPPPTGDGRVLNTPDHRDFDENAIDTYVLTPDSPVRWQELRAFQIQLEDTPNPFDSTPRWTIDRVEVYARNPAGQNALLVEYDQTENLTAPDNINILVQSPTAEQVPTAVALTDYVSEADLEAAAQLMEHLEKFGLYYTMATLLGGDPVARHMMFEGLSVGGTPLSELVENRPIDFDGRSLVFPLVGDIDDDVMKRLFGDIEGDALDSGIVSEELISVPTKGVFADGKQGHCNTCEVIDDTRFWDFQKSPIPGDAPQIEPVSTDSRFQAAQNLGATTLPSNIVNIQSPANAPDPAGLAAALKVLGTPEIFRDMSGGKDLADFLTSVVSGSQQLVSSLAGAKGKEELLKTIDGLGSLSAAEKTELAKAVLGTPKPAEKKGEEKKDEKGKDGDKKTEGSDKSSGTPKSASGSSGSGQSNVVASAKRPTKPERPVEPGIDGFTIRVTQTEADIAAETLQNLGRFARFEIAPSGQTSTGRMLLDRNPHEFRMPPNTRRDGILKVHYQVAPAVTVDPGTAGVDVDTEVAAIKASLPAVYDSTRTFPYKLDTGVDAIDVHLQHAPGGKVVEGVTFGEAYASFIEGIEGVPFVTSVATMSEQSVETGASRPWIFHYVSGPPTITVDDKKISE